MDIIRKDFPGLHVEALTVGKRKNNPQANEDGFVITKNTFAVIDGSAPRTDIKYQGKSSAQLATEVAKNVLLTTEPTVNGKDLVSAITTELNKKIDQIGARDIVQKTKEAAPAALFTAARIVGDKIVIIALGDIGCRINGNIVHEYHIESEEIMTKKRIAAMKKAKKENPQLSNEQLRAIGQEAIRKDLRHQVYAYFNNPKSTLCVGVINGQDVPEACIKTYSFPLAHVKTLEIFSDGYFILPGKPAIEAWEKAFFAGESKDPLRWEKYPAVKAATKDTFSDDRTIVIVKRV